MSSTYNSGFDLTREDVIKMTAAVDSLINETSQACNQYDNKPAPNSLASQEQETFPKQELGLSRNSRENRISVEGQPNVSNGLARRESEL